jgi:hypothetical protein
MYFMQMYSIVFVLSIVQDSVFIFVRLELHGAVHVFSTGQKRFYYKYMSETKEDTKRWGVKSLF